MLSLYICCKRRSFVVAVAMQPKVLQLNAQLRDACSDPASPLPPLCLLLLGSLGPVVAARTVADAQLRNPSRGIQCRSNSDL